MTIEPKRSYTANEISNTPQRESQIGSQMSRLICAVSNQEKAADKLADRLNRITTPEPSEASPKETCAPREMIVQFAEDIRQQAERIERMTVRMLGLTERIEL